MKARGAGLDQRRRARRGASVWVTARRHEAPDDRFPDEATVHAVADEIERRPTTRFTSSRGPGEVTRRGHLEDPP